MILLTIIVFIAMLLALVLVHEWGHFIAAKKAGCNVEEFGFGFPPRVASIVKNGTRYSLNLFPIGGFVKIKGENMDESSPDSDSFATKSASWRIIILSAGVAMNMVLAYVLLSAQSIIGAPVVVTDQNAGHLASQQTYILEVAEGSPAEEAGLKDFDRITRIEGVENPTVENVQQAINTKLGSTIAVEIDRQGVDHTLQVTARANPPEGEGATGIVLAATGLEKTPWYLAPWEGLKRTYQMLAAIFVQFGAIIGRLFAGGSVGETLTGPIGIAVYTNEATQLGPSYLLEFAALISINLAIINILPLPALDGGRIVFVVIEKLIGRRVPGKVEQYAHTAGFALLILLMVLITAKDVGRYF